MKSIVSKIVPILLAIVFVFQFSIVFAASTNSLTSQKSSNQEEITNAESDLEEVQEEKSEAVSQVEEIETQITSYETEISDLEDKIDSLVAQIAESETKIAEAEAEYEEKTELLNERLVVMYEEGNTSYIDVLLSSDSLTDFISNFYLISELASYDTELLEEINNKKLEIEQEKASLETSKSELDTSKVQKQSVQTQLEVAKEEKSQYVSELSEEEQDIQEKIDQLKEDNKAIDAQLAEIEKKLAAAANNSSSSSSGSTTTSGSGSNNTSTSTASSSGFIHPVSGYSITTGWYYSNGSVHGAVDYSGSGIYGATVMASKAGTVAYVGALSTSYGTYVMIRHDDGWYTLYAHGIAGSVTVSAGDRVSQGQKIMQVGSTGNSTGAHLHFEIRTSYSYSSRVNPLNYLP